MLLLLEYILNFDINSFLLKIIPRPVFCWVLKL